MAFGRIPDREDEATMNVPAHQGPLARFKVIDLSRVRAGPTAVRQLAD
jgi:formyl-CoA transferase